MVAAEKYQTADKEAHKNCDEDLRHPPRWLAVNLTPQPLEPTGLL